MKLNLNKPAGNSNAGSAAGKNEIIIFDVQDLSFFPPSDDGGVEIEGSFVLNAGGNMIKVYSTKSKTEASMETDGDEDMMSFKSKVVLQHPGNSKEVKEFVQMWTGRDVIVMHKACGENHYEVMGTPCAPLQLKATKQDNNDGRMYNLTFEPFAKSAFVPKIYTGAVVFAEPFTIADVSPIAITSANGLQYNLPALDTTEAIVFPAIDIEHGKTISLIGFGGLNPATLVSGVSGAVTVVLAAGSTWTAIRNASIHLKVFKAGATTYLFELSRQ